MFPLREDILPRTLNLPYRNTPLPPSRGDFFGDKIKI